MNCEEIQPKLLDYSRSQTSALETKDIREHLAGCAECRQVLAEETALDAALRDMPTAAPRTDLWPLVRTSVRGRRPLSARLRAMFARPKRALAAALATAVAATAVVLVVPDRNQPAPIETKAVVVYQNAQPSGAYDDPMGDNTSRILAAIEEGT